MANNTYITGRKQYGRPQAILLANNQGFVDNNGFYLPYGNEGSEDNNGNEFIILSDDNREKIDITPTRIEQRRRMVNGRMRSYYVGDKLTISTSWAMLPSRSFDMDPQFDSNGNAISSAYSYTSDGGAGGVDILRWYEKYSGSFWVYLAYDKYTNFTTSKYSHLAQYNQVLEVFFKEFNYGIVKRGHTTHDYWDISFSLEEA